METVPKALFDRMTENARQAGEDHLRMIEAAEKEYSRFIVAVLLLALMTIVAIVGWAR